MTTVAVRRGRPKVVPNVAPHPVGASIGPRPMLALTSLIAMCVALARAHVPFPCGPAFDICIFPYAYAHARVHARMHTHMAFPYGRRFDIILCVTHMRHVTGRRYGIDTVGERAAGRTPPPLSPDVRGGGGGGAGGVVADAGGGGGVESGLRLLGYARDARMAWAAQATCVRPACICCRVLAHMLRTWLSHMGAPIRHMETAMQVRRRRRRGGRGDCAAAPQVRRRDPRVHFPYGRHIRHIRTATRHVTECIRVWISCMLPIRHMRTAKRGVAESMRVRMPCVCVVGRPFDERKLLCIT